MGIVASATDLEAYIKVGKAADNLLSVWPYVSKGIKSYSEFVAGSQIMSVNTIAPDIPILKTIDNVRTTLGFAVKIAEFFNPAKRVGAGFKLALKVTTDIVCKKLLGISVSTHPYYAYHKIMLDALEKMLNASEMSHMAIDAYFQSVRHGGSAKLQGEFKRIQWRKVEFSVAWGNLPLETLGLAYGLAQNNFAPKLAAKKLGEAAPGAIEQALADLESWRCVAAGIAFDAMLLQIMAGEELDLAMAADAQRAKLIAQLKSGETSMQRVAGFAAENTIEMEKFAASGGANAYAAIDAVGSARLNYDKASRWALTFAEMSDFARTKDAIYATRYNKQLAQLNAVIYT